MERRAVHRRPAATTSRSTACGPTSLRAGSNRAPRRWTPGHVCRPVRRAYSTTCNARRSSPSRRRRCARTRPSTLLTRLRPIRRARRWCSGCAICEAVCPAPAPSPYGRARRCPGPMIPALLDRVDGICLGGRPRPPPRYGQSRTPRSARRAAARRVRARLRSSRDRATTSMRYWAIGRGMPRSSTSPAAATSSAETSPAARSSRGQRREPGPPTHDVEVEPGKPLAAIPGATSTPTVNPSHHQAKRSPRRAPRDRPPGRRRPDRGTRRPTGPSSRRAVARGMPRGPGLSRPGGCSSCRVGCFGAGERCGSTRRVTR